MFFFLREMRELAKNQVTDSVLRELFLAQLPPITAGILEMMSEEYWDALAKAADKGWAREGQGNIASTSTIPTPPQPGNPQEVLVNRMVEALDRWSENNRKNARNSTRKEARQRRDGRSPTPGKSGRDRSRSRKRNPKHTLCYAHHKYGDQARNCVSWCEKWPMRNENKLENQQG